MDFKKITSFNFFFLFLFSFSIFAQVERSVSSIPAATLQKNQEIQNVIQIYKTHLDSGNLLDAKEQLLQALELTEETELKEKYFKKLYDLNVQILFSRTMTENSALYEVKPGDTLGKIAKEYHTTVELIQKSNGLLNDLIRPKEKFKVFTGKFKVFVDKSDNKLRLFADDELIKEYRVATGENNSTPVGGYKIETKLIDPTWYHAGAVVPPESPENILGSRWLGINYPGYGIHGTTIPESIGTQSTAGCVRMLNEDVEEIFAMLPYGTEVEIVD